MVEAEVDRHTTVNIHQWLQKVCSTKLFSNPIILGGSGVVVQINESLFWHKPKVKIITI